jgi:RNA polymerase sigma-70 factor (ECF subfamily)
MIAFLDLLDSEEEKTKFEKLYNKYADLLMWIALRKLSNNHHLAEEVVQETFLYIAKNFHKIGDVESKQTKCYLATIAQGFAINKYNNESKTIPFSFEIDDDISFDNMDDSYLANLDILDLKTAINSLSDEFRNFLYLTYIYGYNSKEISKMYGISPELVRKKIQFAKIEVRKYFERGVNGNE